MMRRSLAAFIVVLGSACGSSDGPKVLVNGILEVAPKNFVFHKFQTDYPGTYTLTVTPQGEGVEGWVSPGLQEPRFEFLEDDKLPLAKPFGVGKDDTLTGPLDWGGAHIVLYNRGSAPVKVKCHLSYLEKKPG